MLKQHERHEVTFIRSFQTLILEDKDLLSMRDLLRSILSCLLLFIILYVVLGHLVDGLSVESLGPC